ncbi:MAG: organomercurial lyase [Acidimicrobiia bacterium]
MTPIRSDTLAAFDQGWLEVVERTPLVRLVYGLAGLTRLGERPAPLARLAAVLDRPEQETIELLRVNTSARIEDGLVHWDDPFPGPHVRRMIHVGAREVPMRSGCAPDVPLFAAVLDVPFGVEDRCAATGTPIRVDFVPDGYEHAEPAGAVTVLLPVDDIQVVAGGSFEQIDAGVCVSQPFFASRNAAQDWLHQHPGGRAFTIGQMFERPIYRYVRDTVRPLVYRRADP